MAAGRPRKAASTSRLLKLLIPLPLSFVITNQGLIIQSIDLDRHWREIGGEDEHCLHRVIVQKP